ncbi:PAS domain-containing protein [Bernardetia sp. OM2101]|uniref:PAS domain-containing protein n=1 Tax=Bernardetia sp. OM2101 TaxID=3344876 RepID=UPI0035D0CCCD
MNYLKKEFYQILKSDEEFFDFNQSIAINGLWFWNIENVEKKWINPAFNHALGYEDNYLDTDSLVEIVYEKDRDVLNQIQSFSQKNTFDEQLIRFYHKDGSIICFSFSFLVVKNKNQESSHVVIGYKEITHKNIYSLIKRYESILNNHSTFIIRIDMNANYTYANDYFCECFGLDKQNIVGKNAMSSILVEDHKKCIEVAQKCVENPNQPYFIFLKKPLPNNQIAHTEWEYRAITNQDGQVAEIQCVGVDVSERIAAEKQKEEQTKELVHTQKLLNTCNSHAKIGVWNLDLKTGIVQWDKIARDIHEVDENFVIHNNGIEFYQEKDKLRIEKVGMLAMTEGKSPDEQFEIITYKGNKKWIRVIGVPIMENEVCIEFYGTIQDITSQKHVELELKEKVEELEKAQKDLIYTQQILETCNENSRVGIWELDLQTQFIKWDKIIREIHEVDENFIVDTKIGVSFYKNQEQEKIKKNIALAIQYGISYDDEFQFITNKGNNRWVRATGVPTMKNGVCVALYGTFQDITDKKEKEIQFQEKIEELESTQNQLIHTQKLLDTTNEAAKIGTWELNLDDFSTNVDKVTRQIHQVDDDFTWNVDNAILFYKEGYSREKIAKVFKRAFEEGVPYDEQLKIVTTKGNEVWIRTIGIPTFENGKCVELYGTFQDITPQKEAELEINAKVEELEITQHQLIHIKKLLDASNEAAQIGTWELDLNNYAVIWDKVTKSIHEVDTNFVTTVENGIEFYTEGYSRDTIQIVFKKALEEGTAFDKELKIITAKGNKIWVRVIGVPTFENGKCVELYGTTQNIDKQKRNEIALQQKLEELKAAQQKIQKIQKNLTLTLEKTNVGLWNLNLTTGKPFWDEKAYELFKETKENFTPQKWQDKIHPEDLEYVLKNVDEFMKGNLPTFDIKYRMIHTNNVICYYHSQGVLVEEDKEQKIIGIVQDITKEKEYEQIIEKQNKKLADSEKVLKKGFKKMYHLQQDLENQKQQLEQIFDAVPAMIYQFKRHKNGDVSFPLVSKGSEIILGVESEQIRNTSSKEIFEAIHPDDFLDFEDSVQQSAEKMQQWESELRLMKEGKEVWIHATSKPTLIEDGEIVWTGIMQNIDELKATELKIQKQNKQLQETLDELRETQSQLIHNEKMTTLGQLVASIAHEINTPLGAIRSSAGTIFKLLKDALSKLPKVIKLLSEEQLGDFNTLIEKSMETNAIYSSREKRAIKYNLIADLETKNISQADRIADMLVDTGLHSESELYEPFLKLPQAVQIFDSIYEVSTILKSNSTVRIATEKAAKIIITLKNFSRQDHTGEKKPTNINKNLENTLILYQNKLKHGIEVVRDMQDIPIINAYEDELAQVWTNLLHNAIQAIDKKGIIYLTTKKEENNILVSIRDTGKGIPDKVQKRIFDAFFTTKPVGEGSGLGLNIVKKIIEKHEGKIWFETENIGKNTGTTFFVELPLDKNR